MKARTFPPLGVAIVLLLFRRTVSAANAQFLGWNNLGMHCMDSDYSVFSILPPYNTIEAQLIVGGLLVTNGGYTVTYQAVADPAGSFNSTAAGKGNFYNFALPLFGANLPVDAGIGRLGHARPQQHATRNVVRANQHTRSTASRRHHAGQLVARRGDSAFTLRRCPQEKSLSAHVARGA